MNRQFFRFETRPTNLKNVARAVAVGVALGVAIMMAVRLVITTRGHALYSAKNNLPEPMVVIDRDPSDGMFTVRDANGDEHQFPKWMFHDDDARQVYVPPHDDPVSE